MTKRLSNINVKQQLLKARDLLQQRRFEEARAILVTIEHPTAEKWLAKIDEAHPPIKVKPQDREAAIQAQLRAARNLIKAQEYDAARSMLVRIDHPTAEKWLEKLDDMEMFSAPAAVTQVTVNQAQGGSPGCLIQVLWFFFIGWWAGAAWITLAWGFMLTILGLPLAIWMIHRVSRVIALRVPPQRPQTNITVAGNVTHVEVGAAPEQVNFFLRLIWFLLIGWWASGLWMSLAYTICLTILGMPVGFWMFDKTPRLLTLKR